ncbi:MAG: lipid A deacylase LpxR family protein [Thermodesulfobacteriota bacterium]
MNRIHILALLLSIGIFFPCAARPEEPAGGGTLSVVFENDVFYNNDRQYTSGLLFLWVPDREASPQGWARKAARLLPWVPENGRFAPGYSFGQSIFTAKNLGAPVPFITDRPYAGWLYGSAGLNVRSDESFDRFQFFLGAIGPASLAEETQEALHVLLGSEKAQGWDFQLGNEPGAFVTYRHGWRGLLAKTMSGKRLDFTPHAGGALGNVFTYGNAGFTVRYGRNLPDDDGPPRIQPGLQGWGDFSPADGFRWYLYGGVDARAVARDVFLDGNTFRGSRSVEREPLVCDFEAGFVLAWSRYRLSFANVLRTREFTTQDKHNTFGALTFSVGK